MIYLIEYLMIYQNYIDNIYYIFYMLIIYHSPILLFNIINKYHTFGVGFLSDLFIIYHTTAINYFLLLYLVLI